MKRLWLWFVEALRGLDWNIAQVVNKQLLAAT